MAGIEIREDCGDIDGLVEFICRIWIAEYAGRMWFSVPDEHTIRRWSQGGGCFAAYHGTKIVGTAFAVPYSVRVGPSVLSIPFITGFTVDPDHPRVAVQLVERAHRRHAERKIPFSIGGFAGDRRSASYRFWTEYAKIFPQKYRYLFRTSHWFKILAPGPFGRAGITAWQRLGSGTLGRLLSLTPHGHDPNVRPCRAGDLERCSQLLDKASADFDWAVRLSAKRLADELDDPESGILVLERDGDIRAMVRYRCVTAYGRQAVRGAAIELWADDGLTGGQRARLLGHVCNHLRDHGAHVVQALRCAMMPTSAFVANMFLPTAHMYLAALVTRPELAPTPPKNWSLVLT